MKRLSLAALILVICVDSLIGGIGLGMHYQEELTLAKCSIQLSTVKSEIPILVNHWSGDVPVFGGETIYIVNLTQLVNRYNTYPLLPLYQGTLRVFNGTVRNVWMATNNSTTIFEPGDGGEGLFFRLSDGYMLYPCMT
jgi:hypothetical protein